MVGVKVVPCAERIGGIVHISLRITNANCTYISQRITGHPEAGESRTVVSDRALYIAYLKSKEAVKCLSSLHDKYVIVPVDKASNNIVFVGKSYYFECLIKELGINSNTSSNTTYKSTSTSTIADDHQLNIFA